MCYIVLAFLGVLAAAAALGNTRVARLKRMARTFNLRYKGRVETPLTPLSAKEVKFFSRGFHHFFHVLTWEEGGAFTRVCEDQIFLSPLAKVSQASYTLWTVELTRGTFVPFVLVPRSRGEFPKDAVFPPGLEERFALIAPQGYQLPAKLIDLLKTGPDCYVETTLYSLVYHEYKRVSVSQIQAMRLHVRTLVKELAQLPKGTASAVSKPTLTAEELQVSAMLTLQNRSQADLSVPSAARFWYVLVGFVILIGILIATRYFLAMFAH